jgi:hypothetical protein
MDMNARLAALAAATKPWRYVVHYDDGSKYSVPTLTRDIALSGAERYIRNIGRSYISRATGASIIMTKVIVEPNDA